MFHAILPFFTFGVSLSISKTETVMAIFENVCKLKYSDYLHPPLHSLLCIYSLLYLPRQEEKTHGNALDIKNDVISNIRIK